MAAGGGGAWPPQQWAMLTEDTVVCHVDRYGGIHQPVPNENFHSLEIEKRIWLFVEGNWGDDAHLQRRWADDIINEQWASVNAGLAVVKIRGTEWPAISKILPAGLQVLTKETWSAWCTALESFFDGDVAEAETTLRNAGLMPA